MKKITFILATLALMACQPQNQTNSGAESASPTPVSAAVASNTQTSGIDIRNDHIGGDFTLTGPDGQPFSMNRLHGKVVILSFGFTNCPDVCPTELLSYNDALKQLGEQAKDVVVVFVSVDPDRDTPELIGRYAAQFNPEFIGLTDTKGGRDLAFAKQLYNVVSAKTEIQSDTLYNVDHSSGAFLLDKQGNAAIFEPYGSEASQIATDIKTLLAE